MKNIRCESPLVSWWFLWLLAGWGGGGSLSSLMTHWWACFHPAIRQQLENKSRGIPELRLHHGVIIATWLELTLNKQMKLYLAEEVISEYLFDGS